MTKTSESKIDKEEFLWVLKGKKRGGRLERWCLSPHGDNKIIGVVYESPNEKFTDGDVVATSRLDKIETLNERKVAVTRHSYYELGKPGTDEDLEDHYKHFYKDRDNY